MQSQFRCFSLEAQGAGSDSEELNRFLRSQRVIDIRKEFSGQPAPGRWNFLVEYLPSESPPAGAVGSRKIDYKEVLSETDFALFSRLRDRRKIWAEKAGVPVFAVFTNEQLAQIAKNRPVNAKQLGQISGIGPSRIQQYGKEIYESNGTSDAPDPESGKFPSSLAESPQREITVAGSSPVSTESG